MKNDVAVRDLVAQLGVSMNALVAVGLALRARTGEVRLDERLQGRVDDVLAALGSGVGPGALSDAEAAPMLAGLRADLLMGAKLIGREGCPASWSHHEADLLHSFGDVSSAFPSLLRTRIAPQLAGLSARLGAAEASFLDIGVGVAALSIAMVRQWPSLGVVGIDPWAPSLALARENVRRAGLDKQIVLREEAAEELADVDAYDLVWVPSLFIPEEAIPSIIQRAARALRPGGWLLLAMVNPASDPLVSAVMRFRTAVWGGSLLPWETIGDSMFDAGLVDARLLSGPPASPVAMAAARRR